MAHSASPGFRLIESSGKKKMEFAHFFLENQHSFRRQPGF
jgi:hypothetical protein